MRRCIYSQKIGFVIPNGLMAKYICELFHIYYVLIYSIHPHRIWILEIVFLFANRSLYFQIPY